MKRAAKYGDFEEACWLLKHAADPARKIKAYPDERNYGRMPMVEEIYYKPIKPRGTEWRRRCPRWLRDHGIERPAIRPMMQEDRKKLGLPTEERDISLL